MINSRDCQDSLEHWWNEYGEGNACHKIICNYCGKVFYARSPKAKYCSYRCTNDAQIDRRKQRKELERDKLCPVCGNKFHAKRKDSIYCSNKCKQKAYRQNKEYVTAFRLAKNSTTENGN